MFGEKNVEKFAEAKSADDFSFSEAINAVNQEKLYKAVEEDNLVQFINEDAGEFSQGQNDFMVGMFGSNAMTATNPKSLSELSFGEALDKALTQNQQKLY